MLRFRAMVGMSDTERSWMDGKGGETQPAPVEAVSEVPKGYLAEEAKSEIRFLGSKITPCLRNEAVKEDCTRTLEENNASVMEQSGQDPVGLTEVKRDVDGALTPERRLSEHTSCVRQLQREIMESVAGEHPAADANTGGKEQERGTISGEIFLNMLSHKEDASTVGGKEYSGTPPGAENASARSSLFSEVEQEVERDLDVWKPDKMCDSLRMDQWNKERRVKRWQQMMEEELQVENPVYTSWTRLVYEIGWKSDWAVTPPGDSAFPPLPSRSVQGRKHAKAMQWNELKWTSETASTVDEKRKKTSRGVGDIAGSGKKCRV